MSTEQKENLDTIVRQSAFPADMEADPLLSRENLQARVPDYTAGQDAAAGLISPVFADLSGLPSLIIQAGSHEVLLGDAVRLARQAAIADVEVALGRATAQAGPAARAGPVIGGQRLGC